MEFPLMITEFTGDGEHTTDSIFDDCKCLDGSFRNYLYVYLYKFRTRRHEFYAVDMLIRRSDVWSDILSFDILEEKKFNSDAQAIRETIKRFDEKFEELKEKSNE